MAFCTLFDSFYFLRGAAMARSLRKFSQEKLYVLAMDTVVESRLKEWGIPDLIIIPLQDFLTQGLIDLQKSRSKGEFCWTCTPFLIEYVLQEMKETWAVYLDADLCFFSSPDILIQRWHQSDAPLLLSRHRYLPEVDQTEISGIYCVQFNGFLARPDSLRSLQWWRDKCQEWCFAKAEPNRFGDQKYLDFIEAETQVIAHINQHPGEGLAPWNCAGLSVRRVGDRTYVSSPSDDKLSSVIFYHFHGYRLFEHGLVDDCQYYYHLPDSIRSHLYRPYTQSILGIAEELAIDKGYDFLPAYTDHELREKKRRDTNTFYLHSAR